MGTPEGHNAAGTQMRTIRGWRKAARQLESWRKKLTPVQVSLKRPRAVDATAVDLASGEPVEPARALKSNFQARLIFFTGADVTLRRPSGAVLIVDTYELEWLSDGKTRVVP